MISKYNYIDVPKNVDLKQKLMPLRDEEDQGWFYGVDPAWLYEIINTWLVIFGWNIPSKYKMPEYPAIASFHNAIRINAAHVKSEQSKIYSELPTQTYESVSEIQTAELEDPPAYVKVGDELKKDDIMDVFKWMKPVKVVRFDAGIQTYTTTWNTTHGQEGDGDWTRYGEPGGGHIYRYQWDYWYSSNSWNNNGGQWRRDEGTMTITARLVNKKLEWFKNFKVFADFQVRKPFQYFNHLYLPLQNVSMEQDGQYVKVQGTISSAQAKAALNLQEKEYKTDMTTTTYPDGSYSISGNEAIYIVLNNVTWVHCFLELDDDYKAPEQTP